MIEYKKYIGDVTDPRCKGNTIKMISRKTCRNNCKYWKPGKNKKGKCEFGY